MEWIVNFPADGQQSWSVVIGNGWTAVVFSTDVPSGYLYQVSATCDHCTASATTVYSTLSEAKSAAIALTLAQTLCEGMGGECSAAKQMVEAELRDAA